MPFTMPKLVIFDLDGTLVEFPHEFLYLETERILSEFSYPPVKRSILESCFSDFDYFRFMDETKREEFTERFWESFDWPNYPKAVLFPASLAVLERFAEQGVSLAIATARLGPEEKIREDLRETGMLEHLSVIAPREDSSQDWTDKKVQIRHVCGNLGISVKEAIMVGDTPPDIESAKELGLACSVAVLSGGINKDILEKVKPDLLISNIGELGKYFS